VADELALSEADADRKIAFDRSFSSGGYFLGEFDMTSVLSG